MKICKPHWEELTRAIEQRGLMKFVARDGEEASKRVEAQLTPGESALAGFDPLMNANFAIWSNGLKSGGMYLVGEDEDGNPYCPLCELEKHSDGKASDWIGYAADEQLEKARAFKLLPPNSVQ